MAPALSDPKKFGETAVELISKHATRWTIACGIGWALAMMISAALMRSWANLFSNLGYLFLILALAGVRRSIVTTAAATAIGQADLVNQITPANVTVEPTSVDPAVRREIEKRLTQ